MNSEQPSTETVSDARLQDLINLYDGQAFRGDTVLALEELQRLRHYVATCGGTDNDGRCPMHHLAGLRSSGGASGKFNGCVTCGSTEYPHDCNAPEPSERQPDGYAYRYPDGYIRFSGGREVNGSDPVETIPYYFRRAPEPGEQYESGWVIEGAWSPTDQPEYWVGSSTWSTDPYKALRFANQQSAQQAADLMCDGLNVRICEHEWACSTLTKVDKP